MVNNNVRPPTTPRKTYLTEPLKRADYVTPISGTISSLVSAEGAVVVPRDILKQYRYQLADLNTRKTIPVDVFLLCLGVSRQPPWEALHTRRLKLMQPGRGDVLRATTQATNVD